MNQIARILLVALLILSVLAIPSVYFDARPIEVNTDLAKTQDKTHPDSLEPTPVQFKDEAISWGLLAKHEQNSKGIMGIDDILGSGLCIFDADGDGWEDLLLIGGGGEKRFYGRVSWWPTEHSGNTLWRNINGQHFENISQDSGITTASKPMGCASGDLDNDGDADLVITNLGHNQFLINRGNGQFEDLSEQIGLQEQETWSTSATIADYNGDGLADIYITNFISYQRGIKVFERASGFVDTKPENMDAQLYDSQANHLYENQGNLEFLERANEAGVADISGKGLAAQWLDINNDNKLDLLVANSRGTPNRLFINDGQQKSTTFSPAPIGYRVESSLGSHSLAVGDIDHDAYIDIFMSSPTGLPPRLLQHQRDENDKPGLIDLTWESGLAKNTWLYRTGWAIALGDFNNDNTTDVFIGNGSMTVSTNTPYVSTGQQDSLWLNRINMKKWGDSRKTELTAFIDKEKRFKATSFPGNIVSPTRGVAITDVNQDGKMDIISTQNNDFVRLLINHTETQQAWLGLSLDSLGKYARQGATVELQINGQIIEKKRLRSSSGFLSQSTDRLHFALPNTAGPIQVSVRWPSGPTNKYQGLKPNNYWLLRQDGTHDLLSNRHSEGEGESKNRGSIDSLLDSLEDKQKKAFLSSLKNIKKDKTLKDKKTKQALKKYLSSIMMSDDTNLKHKALSITPYLPDILALNLIQIALEDSDSSIRKAAVSALIKKENEISISWLIKATGDQDPIVRCESARAFEVFFREEEAVIKRKKLGVPELIKLLNDNDDQVKLCAIQALAEAENFRAVKPLIMLLQDPKTSVPVKASSARALGLLRYRHALNVLIQSVETPEAISEVAAQALVALKRLNYQHLPQLLQETLLGKGDEKSIYRGLSVALHILTNTEAKAVIGQDAISENLTPILESLRSNILADEIWISTALELLAYFNSEENHYTIKKYLSHNDETISRTALLTLAKTSFPKNGLYEWSYFNFDTETQNDALELLLKNNHQLIVSDARQLLKNELTAKTVMNHIHLKNYHYTMELIDRPETSFISYSHQQVLLQWCSEQNNVVGQMKNGWFDFDITTNNVNEIDKKWHQLALSCWIKTSTRAEGNSPSLAWLTKLINSSDKLLQNNALRALARHPDTKANQLLIRIIKDKQTSQELRFEALAAAAEQNKPYALTIAFHYATQLQSNMNEQAARIIEAYANKEEHYDFLRGIADNKKLPFNKRWPSIEKLVNKTDQTVLDFL